MKRILATLIALLACGGASTSVPPPSTTPSTIPTPGQWIALPGDARGYLVAPASNGKHAGVVVIQEWWGVTDWIRGNTARFASDNYVTIAVDLYRGKIAKTPDEAHELSRGLPTDRALTDLRAGVAYLASRPDVDPARIGVVGWCMGGGYALELAAIEPQLRAVVVNYGHVITAPQKLDAIHAAVLGNFGLADRGIAPEDVRELERALKVRRVDADLKLYDGAGHAFMNPDNKSGYVDAATQDAWQRIEGFFRRTLGSAK